MASHSAFYVQACPTCGRLVRVCVQALGRSVPCRHCQALFTACDPESIAIVDGSRPSGLNQASESAHGQSRERTN